MNTKQFGEFIINQHTSISSVFHTTYPTHFALPCSALPFPALPRPARSIMMEFERNSRANPKSLSPPTRANPFASSVYPKSPNLASSGSVSRSKTSQVRAPFDPGKGISSPRKACMCSPTSHPGSFRCHLHRKSNTSSSAHSQLNARRSAMANSLGRIGGVEGEWVRRALTTLIRPSSHHMRRKTSFQPRPSRLCHMTTAQVDMSRIQPLQEN